MLIYLLKYKLQDITCYIVRGFICKHLGFLYICLSHKRINKKCLYHLYAVRIKIYFFV